MIVRGYLMDPFHHTKYSQKKIYARCMEQNRGSLTMKIIPLDYCHADAKKILLLARDIEPGKLIANALRIEISGEQKKFFGF